VLEDGVTGLLADFFDAEAIAERTLQVLRDPAAYAPIKQRAIELVQGKYSTEANYPKLVELYEATARGSSAAR
jgi:glycosyltransferase involved in cell wall biosynthesis